MKLLFDTIRLSVTSVWEMQIKLHLGKLRLDLPLPEVIKSQRHTNNVVILPIVLDHVLTLETLPDHHKDPFDRLLIAQAIVEDAVLVTNDPIVQKYPAKWVW